MHYISVFIIKFTSMYSKVPWKVLNGLPFKQNDFENQSCSIQRYGFFEIQSINSTG